MRRLTRLKHRIVRRVHNIVNTANPNGLKPLYHPLRRLSDLNIGYDPRRITCAVLLVQHRHIDKLVRIQIGLSQLHLRHLKLTTRNRCYLPGNTDIAKTIPTVAGNLYIDNLIAIDFLYPLKRKSKLAQNISNILSTFVDLNILTKPLDRYLHYKTPKKVKNNLGQKPNPRLTANS